MKTGTNMEYDQRQIFSQFCNEFLILKKHEKYKLAN